MIVDKIHKALINKSYADSKPITRLTASTIGECERSVFYLVKDFERQSEPSPELLLKFRDGHMHHEEIAKLIRLSRNVKLVGAEQSVMCGSVYSRVDAVVAFGCGTCDMRDRCWYRKKHGRPQNLLHRCEFKSMAPSSYDIYLNNGLEAFPTYYAQAQVGACAEPILPFLYVVKNKGTSELFEEIIEPNFKYAEELNKKKVRFDEALLSNEIPDRPYEYNSDECQGCSWLYKCWFSDLRDREVTQSVITYDEHQLIIKIVENIRRLEPVEAELAGHRGFLEALMAGYHTKYNTKKIKVPDLSSSAVAYVKEYPNLDYIRSVLTELEYSRAFEKRPVKFIKVYIKKQKKVKIE